MSILSGMIFIVNYKNGYGNLIIHKLSMEDLILLMSISHQQKENWVNSGLVPLQVLVVFWFWGIRFEGSVPLNGIKLNVLVRELMWFMKQRKFDIEDRKLADYICKNIVKYEIQSRVKKYHISRTKTVIGPTVKIPLKVRSRSEKQDKKLNRGH